MHKKIISTSISKRMHFKLLYQKENSAIMCRPLLWLGSFWPLSSLFLGSVSNSLNGTDCSDQRSHSSLQLLLFFPFLQKPLGSGFIVFNVLSSLKITQKANNWFSCCLFPMRIQMSACTQCLLLPTEMYKQKLAAPHAAFQSDMLFGEDINEMAKRKEAWTWSQTKPRAPTKMCEGQSTGQMFVLKLSSCFSTSNSDVTLGAFFKWFRYLHPLSAAGGVLNQQELRSERIAI